jgi:hypothetical protein
VAIYYLGMKTFGRSSGKRGSRATSAAAYRAGERIRDERTGMVYDHHRRHDVMHKEIVLPAKLARAGRELDWARHRATLWNAAEHAEARANARVAREFVVALPHELTHGQRAMLTRRFAQELADRYGNAIDVAIHAPRGDPRNFHAHLLATTREITSDGLGPKTTLERSGTERHRLGLPRWMDETRAVRERWAVLANEALENAHLAVRIAPVRLGTERSLGTSAPRLPPMAYRIEQRGGRSILAERIRAAHRAMVPTATLDPVDRTATNGRGPPDSNEGRIATTGSRGNLVTQFWARAREVWVALSGDLRGHALDAPGTAPVGSPIQQDRSAEEPMRKLARDAAPQDAVALEGFMPDSLAREAAREWLRRYGSGAVHGVTHENAPEIVAAVPEPGRAITREHEHDYGLDL